MGVSSGEFQMKKFFYVLILIFVSNFVFAANNALALKNVLNLLHKNYDNVTTFKSDFKQISFFKAVNQVQEYRGTLYLKKPDKMRWDYFQPEQQSIISNGKTIWYYYPSENQVSYAQLSGKSKEKNLIFILLEGASKVEKTFDMELISGKDNKNFYYLQLVPKEPNTELLKIILTISFKEGRIKVSHVYYVNGDIAKVVFEKDKLNPKLENSFFNFTPPPGCEAFKIPTHR
jgi:outer membrane lipoprotein carrier protein